MTLFRETMAEGKQASVRLARRVEDDNPCYKESQLSFKCMAENDYDKDKCVLFFENYKNCKGFWTEIRKDRKRNGTKPYLPLPEDRDRVKAEFLSSKFGISSEA